MTRKTNATGKESRRFDKDELRLIAEETQADSRFPGWVTTALMAQVDDNAE